MLIKDTLIDFYTFDAFTYINLQVGSGGERKRGKECDGETFVKKKKKIEFCFVTTFRACPEAAAHTQSLVTSCTLAPKRWP